MVEDIEDACEVYKNHMGGELQDGQSKASDLLREQIEKMGLLAAAAEEERDSERRERTAMQGKLQALQEETKKATNAADHCSRQVTGLAASVDEFAESTTSELALTKQAGSEADAKMRRVVGGGIGGSGDARTDRNADMLRAVSAAVRTGLRVQEEGRRKHGRWSCERRWRRWRRQRIGPGGGSGGWCEAGRGGCAR